MKKRTVSLSNLTLSGYVASWEMFPSQRVFIYFLASLLYILTMVESRLSLEILVCSAISVSMLS